MFIKQVDPLSNFKRFFFLDGRGKTCSFFPQVRVFSSGGQAHAVWPRGPRKPLLGMEWKR
jgi:hypothetical protein